MNTSNSSEESKKKWATPKLIVYGDVEKITKESPLAPSGRYHS